MRKLIHIIILSLFFICSTEAASNDLYNLTIAQNDSLQIDETDVYPRRFVNLKERYNESDFIYERSQQNTGWWSRLKKAISDFFRDLFNIKNAGQASRATDIAIKIAGIIVFLLVIYFIFKAVVNKEGKWVFGKSSDKNIIPVTDIESNLHTTDFKTLIAQAENDNNYRLAIRYYYLWLLKKLTEEEVIEYDVEKTNSDYQNEITSKAISKQFAYTSYLYNYIWYGEFNIDQNEFNKAKESFNSFLKTVKK